MSSPALPTPLPYDPGIEHTEPEEAATAARLLGMMRDIRETTFRHYGHAMRSLHTKSHALLEGELQVLDGLPAALAQGLFARPGRYPVVMRLSTNRGDVIDDDISVPRGMALKVIGVGGERLPGAEGGATQDFVMVNQPAFTEPDLRVFARNIGFVDATTDTGLAWKKMLAALLRPVVAAARALGSQAATLATMGGHPLAHPLGETFYTQMPFRHGAHVAKLSLAPVSPGLMALKDERLDLCGRPNGLREATIAFFRENGAEWELRAQLRTNPQTMPIEDASAEWPEDESPYLAVARVTVPPQPAWSEARARQVDDGLAFSPWHGLAAHQPLGSVNRARREAYAEGARFRAERNRCPIREPRARVGLSDEPAQLYGAAPGREGRRPGTPDRRPGAWSAPMRDTPRRLAAGAAGGLAAGLVLSAAMMGLKAGRGEASGPARLRRRAGGRGHALPTVYGRMPAHAGHLALSVVAGAACAAMRFKAIPSAAAGLAIGLGFHASRPTAWPAGRSAPLQSRGSGVQRAWSSMEPCMRCSERWPGSPATRFLAGSDRPCATPGRAADADRLPVTCMRACAVPSVIRCAPALGSGGGHGGADRKAANSTSARRAASCRERGCRPPGMAVPEPLPHL